MITRVDISNYRSIGGGASLRLGRLTALVGPNGSGKSNFADSLRFISDALRQGLEEAITDRGGIAVLRRWSAGHPRNIALKFHVDLAPSDEHPDGRPVAYEIQIGTTDEEDYKILRESLSFEPGMFDAGGAGFEIVDGRWVSPPADLRPQINQLGLVLPILAADERYRPLVDELKNTSVYSIFPGILRAVQRPGHARPMDEHGRNWCSVLKDLAASDRSKDFVVALSKLTGDIDGFEVRRVGTRLGVRFRHGEVEMKSGKPRRRWFESEQESDGTLRMAGILTALLQGHPPALMGIEEPELTIHPGALRLLYDYIDEATLRGQILLTTHSPDLLDLMDAEDVRVVERRDGITTIGRMEEAQRQMVHDRLFGVGELMRAEGLRQEEVAGMPEA